MLILFGDFRGGKLYRRFTLKSPSTIYPKSSVWFRGGKSYRWFTLKSPSTISGGKSYRWFTPQIAKYDLPQIVCMIYPPEIAREDLPLKSSVRFTPPKSSDFEQNFRHTTSCFASQRSFLRKTNNHFCRLWTTFQKANVFGIQHWHTRFSSTKLNFPKVFALKKPKSKRFKVFQTHS